MFRTTAIVEQTSIIPASGSGIPISTAASARLSKPYIELANRLFCGDAPPRVVAFVCVNRGEGVTRAVQSLAAELSANGRTVALIEGAGELRQPSILDAPLTRLAAEHIERVRVSCDCALIDCGSLERSFDVLALARVVDGVVLVIEAGRTSKHQIERASRLIHDARGTLLGCILNKRRYPVPAWLYRML